MKNILTLENDVKVYLVENGDVLISSNAVRILLDEHGEIRYIKNQKNDKKMANNTEVEERNNEEVLQHHVKKTVSDFLRDAGIPANTVGYHYLRTAILFAYEDESFLIAMYRNLYPKVAKVHNTTAKAVERAIRLAIIGAWERGNTEMLNDFFCSSINPNRGRATNSEFISFVVDNIKNR